MLDPGVMEEELGKIAAYAIWAVLGMGAIEFRHWLSRRAKRPGMTVEAESKKSAQQKEILRELLSKTAAIRTYLRKIHNGDHYVDGSPLLKYSTVAEVARPGTSYEGERFKNVLTSTVNEEMDLVRTEGPSFFIVSKLPPCQFRWLCERTGVMSGCRCAVWRGKELVGFIGLDFNTETPLIIPDIACGYAKWIAETL